MMLDKRKEIMRKRWIERVRVRERKIYLFQEEGMRSVQQYIEDETELLKIKTSF